ncbi:hypothetical protein AACH06_24890 [Ideonella sp. DXS29W]|uniref:DUF4397 domain-containing protein n=1 Tax=Ideonella lacteola TaxID=2984193 RepID=A0ABU9BVT1_9BURK
MSNSLSIQRDRLVRCAAVAGLAWLSGLATAAPILVDSYTAPATAHNAVRSSVSSIFYRDFDASVIGGVRDTTYNVYTNPQRSPAALSLGRGQAGVAAGIGALGELVIRYGAYTRPNGPDQGGPLLRLDLSHHHAVELVFRGVEQALNLNVELYTSAPLDPKNPVYYTLAGVNAAPPAPGEPLVVRLPYNAADGFNYGQVDGVVVLIDRSGSAKQNAYTLSEVRFVED